MFTLMKYELRKTLFGKLILLGLAVAAEGLFIYSLISSNNSLQITSVIILAILALVGLIAIGVQSVLTLHRDMNTKQSYMLFMTPHTKYEILGAKVLENGISTIIAGAFFVALGFTDATLLISHNQSVEELLDLLNGFVEILGAQLSANPLEIIAFISNNVFGWLATVTIAYLADVLASSIFNGKKGGLLICFVIFLALNVVVEKLVGLIPVVSDFTAGQFISAAASLVISAVFYYITAIIMDRHLSV